MLTACDEVELIAEVAVGAVGQKMNQYGDPGEGADHSPIEPRGIRSESLARAHRLRCI
jgi:hypothetical protein